MALRAEPEDPVAVPLASMDAASASPRTNGTGNGNGNGNGTKARELPALLPMDQVPQLPQACGRAGQSVTHQG